MSDNDPRFEYTNDGKGVPIYTPEHWGHDHAKQLLYVETRFQDHGGNMIPDNMNAHPGRFPHEHEAKRRPPPEWKPEWATRIGIDNEQPCPVHCDCDVMEDLEDAGILIHTGPPNFMAALSELGVEVAGELRKYRGRCNAARAKGQDDPPLLREFDWEKAFKLAKQMLETE